MQLLKQTNVENKLDVSRSTLIRMYLRGQFPAPKKIGGKNFWLESEVDGWIAERFGVKAESGVSK